VLKLIDLRMDRVLNYSFKHNNYHNSYDFNKVCFANYGQSVVAGNQDGKVYFWNAENGKIQHILSGGNEGSITACCYNVASGYLYTGDMKGNLVAWS